MLVTIWRKQVHELEASVEKILYAKNPIEIRKIKLWSAAILDIVAMLVAILTKKLTETISGQRGYGDENRVRIRHRLGGEAVGTHGRPLMS